MWPFPELGDIVWCRLPQRPRDIPGPKPKPALVVAVMEYDDGTVVKVAYGTSRKLDRMLTSEFAIRKVENSAAYVLAGLSYDTKFDLNNMLDLPWNDSFFCVPPLAPHGDNPKLGTLHISMMRKLESAVRAAKQQQRT